MTDLPTTHVFPQAKLRVQATYPGAAGGGPESIEVEYNDDAPVDTELIAGIIRQLSAVPGAGPDTRFLVEIPAASQPGPLLSDTARP